MARPVDTPAHEDSCRATPADKRMLLPARYGDARSEIFRRSRATCIRANTGSAVLPRGGVGGSEAFRARGWTSGVVKKLRTGPLERQWTCTIRGHGERPGGYQPRLLRPRVARHACARTWTPDSTLTGRPTCYWLTAVRYLNSTLDPLLSGLMSSLLPTLGTPFLSTTKSM